VDFPQERSRSSIFDISEIKLVKFLDKIFNGFAGVTRRNLSTVKTHRHAVTTTLTVAKMIKPSLLTIMNTLQNSKIVQNANKKRMREKTAIDEAEGATKVIAPDAWDPKILFDFWDNFPSAKAMKAANWPARLIFKVVRIRALTVLRMEMAARSKDARMIFWSHCSPKFPLKNSANEVSIRLYDTKELNLAGKFKSFSAPIKLFRTENSNSCAVQVLNELYEVSKTKRWDDSVFPKPMFISESVRYDPKTKKKTSTMLTGSRLSRIFKVSLICAEVKGAKSKQARHVSSSKAAAYGLADNTILKRCRWSNIKMFRRHYQLKMKVECPALVGTVNFSTAIRIGCASNGMKKQWAQKMKLNCEKFLLLTPDVFNGSAKSSKIPLKTRFQVSNRMIFEAIKYDIPSTLYSDLNFPQTRTGLRSGKRL
jgi:hypothetical protein